MIFGDTRETFQSWLGLGLTGTTMQI